MLTSLALIFLLGLSLGAIFNKIKLPSFIGMIITGIILSPYALNLLDPSILNISADLRRIALVIILTRAGLSLDVKALKRVGRPALLMCFIPACFEIIAVILIAPVLLNISYINAAIMGGVLGAVSPAVIVPRMIRLIEEGYGKEKSIPQLILASASVDDVFVIVLFYSFLSLKSESGINIVSFVEIPISIIVGIILGIISGCILIILFKKIHIRDSVKILIILSISFLLLECEALLENFIPMSGLLAIMTLGITLYNLYNPLAKRLSQKYNNLWIGAEVILFVLVGATVNLEYALKAGISAILLVFLILIFRIIGVYICLIKTNLNKKEKLFCMIAYIPKATVQAAIGGIPLSMGFDCGEIILIVAVLSIIITAPLGATLIDKYYNKLLISYKE